MTTTAMARALSARAVDQITCTALAAEVETSAVNTVTIVGPDGARPSRACPIR
ncbi:hypothetical protein NKG94_06610 [Micromonospora sp. M12]